MSWRRMIALSSLAVGLAAGGCVLDSSVAPDPGPAARGRPQDGAGGVIVEETPATPTGTLTRSQKPDGPPAPQPEVRHAVAHGEAAATIRAVVNTEAILEEEVRAVCYNMMLSASTQQERDKIYQETLNQLIDREVVLQEALGKLNKTPAGKKLIDKLQEDASKEFQQSWVNRMVKSNHLSGEQELISFLREHGMSYEMIRRHWERQFLATQYINFRVGPYVAHIGHTEIAEYYERHPEDFRVTDSVEWQDLFIDAAEYPSRAAARAFAEVLASRARKGESFTELAEKYDRGDSKLRKFKGVGTHKGEVRPPEAEGVLFEMHDGDVAVVQIGSGFHVVQLVHRETAHRKSFDDAVQKEIRDKLRIEIMQREIKHLLADLKRHSVIELYPQH
jgi:parvulin-like peptidyl-prolyl isomerase